MFWGIRMNTLEIINKFINSKGYLESENKVLGIIFYGSRLYKTENDMSDVDLLIVTDKAANYRGVTFIDGIKVEYFEKGYEYLIDKIEDLDCSSDRSLVSIFKNGEVIYSDDYIIESLRDEALAAGRKSIRKRSCYSNVNDWYDCFSGLGGQSNFANYVYHNLIENIRKVYHEENGADDLSTFKVYEMYGNPAYFSKYYCGKLPNKEFRELFIEAMGQDYNFEFVSKLMRKIGQNDGLEWNYRSDYQENQLVCQSVILAGNIDRVTNSLESSCPVADHYYYLALDKVRRLYCRMNDLDERMECFGDGYSAEFMNRFEACLSDDKVKNANLKDLFAFVTEPLNIDYRNYKVLEYHN